MKIGGHVRLFFGFILQSKVSLHVEYVQILYFLHMERGWRISNACATNLGMCSDAAVPLFKCDTPREGPGGGGKSVTLCWNFRKTKNHLWHPILGLVPQKWPSMTWPRADGLSRTRVKGQGQGQGQRSTWQCRIGLCMMLEENGRYSPVMGLHSLVYGPWGKATYLGSGSSVTLRVKGQGQDLKPWSKA